MIKVLQTKMITSNTHSSSGKMRVHPARECHSNVEMLKIELNAQHRRE